MKIYVLDGAGTAGRTSNVIDHTVNILVEDLKAEAHWVKWPASIAPIGGDKSWQDASAIAVRNLQELIREHQDDFVILSYSAGNKPAHDFLNSASSSILNRCKSAGFISDPWRPRGKNVPDTPDPGGYGVMGVDPTPIPDRAFWAAIDGDAITDAFPDALLRYGGDLSLKTPDGIIENAISNWRDNSWQLAWQLGIIQRDPLGWLRGFPGRMAQMRVDVERYFSGYHTTHYTQPFAGGDSMAVRLGRTISWKVRKP